MDIVDEIRHKFGDKIVSFFKKNEKRYYIDIKPIDIIECSRIIFKEVGCRFITATGIDMPKGFELLYHFSDDKTGKIFTLRVIISDKVNPEIESITPIIRAAEWIEREIYEMLGIKFNGHPNLKRLLLSDEFPEGVFPLRQEEIKNM